MAWRVVVIVDGGWLGCVDGSTGCFDGDKK
jgi:hypothetical protein